MMDLQRFQRVSDITGGDDRDTELLKEMAREARDYIMVVEPDDSPPDALERYCGLMEDWIAAVRDRRDLGEVYPVAAKPTAENADLLESRVGFLLAEIIPRATQLSR